MEWMVLAGAIAGVYSLTWLSPALLASIQKTTPLTDPELLSLIHRRLEKSGLPDLRVELWPDEKGSPDNAMVVGVIHAPRFFRARIFISSSLLNKLNLDELDCVMAHEVAHFHLNHLSKRIWLPFGVYTLIVLGGTLATREHLLVVVPLALIAYILAFSVLLRRLVKAQELDADWFAVNKFGVDRETYFRTLEKLDHPDTRTLSHPSVTERCQRLIATPSTAPTFEWTVIKFWMAPVTGTVLILVLSSYLLHRHSTTDRREPATANTIKDSP